MTGKRIELLNLDRTIQRYRFWMSATAPRGGGDLSTPPYVWASSAVNWAWLQWQAEPHFRPISDGLMEAVAHSVTPENRAEAERRGMRAVLDWFVMCCAVLSGDAETAGRAAEGVRDAAFPGDYPTQAVARVLAARVLGDAATERRQLEVSEKIGREKLPPPVPGNALLRSFVERDYAKLNREVTKGSKKHWTGRYLGKRSMPVLVKDEPDRVVIDVSAKDVYSTWAHVEGVFAKLAIQDGARITCDDLWFPRALVSATRGAA